MAKCFNSFGGIGGIEVFKDPRSKPSWLTCSLQMSLTAQHGRACGCKWADTPFWCLPGPIRILKQWFGSASSHPSPYPSWQAPTSPQNTWNGSGHTWLFIPCIQNIKFSKKYRSIGSYNCHCENIRMVRIAVWRSPENSAFTACSNVFPLIFLYSSQIRFSCGKDSCVRRTTNFSSSVPRFPSP